MGGWMKNGLCRKWICCSNCILLKLNNVCSYIKRRWVSLNEQLRCCIRNVGVLNLEMSKVTQPFVLLRLTKWVPGSPRGGVVKSVSSQWLCSLETVEPHHKNSIKRGCKVIFKSKSFKRNMTDWPCHTWLQKKISTTHQQGRLAGVLPTFMHQFGWWDFVYFITKP